MTEDEEGGTYVRDDVLQYLRSHVHTSSGRHDDSGSSLSEMSLAWHAFAGTVTSDEVDEVPTDAWFPDRHNGVKFAVSEQSMRLGGYDTVLTLLTIGDSDN